MSNSAKGRTSYDSTSTGDLIPFFNRNVTPYPTEVGGPCFDLVPVTQQKDLMLNSARMFAQQEYDRIMQLVTVLQKQAEGIRHRLEVTELVYRASYTFQLFAGNFYWLVQNTKNDDILLQTLGPRDWSTGAPDHYKYLCRVKYLGDHTWIEIDENNNPVV